MSTLEYTDLVSVFEGALSEATVLRSALEAAGFATFIANENIKTIDPFATGAGALFVTLFARRTEAEAVRAVLAELRAPEGSMEDEPDDRAFDDRARRRMRVLWLLFFVLFIGLPWLLVGLLRALI